MKKLYTLITIAMMALAFTSCETDEEIAYTLEGTWKGNMYITSDWDGRYYNSTYSEITFLKDPYRYSSGTGYWVDYYSDAPWDYVANHIEWKVDLRTIYVYFVEEGVEMEIRDYSLGRGHFTGQIYDNGNIVDFDLYQASSPNYTNYRWGYSSWSHYSTRGTEHVSAPVEKPRRFVNPELKGQ